MGYAIRTRNRFKDFWFKVEIELKCKKGEKISIFLIYFINFICFNYFLFHPNLFLLTYLIFVYLLLLLIYIKIICFIYVLTNFFLHI